MIVCKSRTAHRAPFMCNMSRATWYEGTAQLLSLTELKSHLFWFDFVGRSFTADSITQKTVSGCSTGTAS